MNFISTRGQTPPHRFSEAVRIGLAPDGGLFVPEELPDLSGKFADWENLSYPELCYEFFRIFADDIPESELKAIVADAYSRFEHKEIAPLVRLDDRLSVLELFHGPTLAFKDFALQLLGGLYERQTRERKEPITVLGATSGDTGAAAINGLLGKEGVSIFILYPDGRVSPLQERQMACLENDNVFPIAVKGSFDDAQTALKEVFGDREFSAKVHLSAVNSINLARILAQCVYYLRAWLLQPAELRERTTFVVPTGNFGNVLAGWLVFKMGMRVAGFRVATNQNDILHRFFSAGDYSIGEVHPSYAPSMDIQIASNFERFLYFAFGQDSEKTREAMVRFKADRTLAVVDRSILSMMSSTSVGDAEIEAAISGVYEKYDYLIDPHTACAFKDLQDLDNAVVLATAHPAKFPDVVKKAIGVEPQHPALEALKSKALKKYSLSADADSIKAFIESKL